MVPTGVRGGPTSDSAGSATGGVRPGRSVVPTWTSGGGGPVTSADGDRGSGRSDLRYLLERAGIAVLTLWVAATLVFLAIHLGPRAPVDETAGDNPGMTPAQEQAALAEKKAEFGLHRPLAVQYADYLGRMFALDFGESWSSRWVDESRRAERTTDVDALIFGERLPRTLWLWGWTVLVALVIGVPIGAALGYSRWSWAVPGATVGGAFLRALPVVLLVDYVSPVLANSERFLFGFDWGHFLVEHYGFTGAFTMDALSSSQGFLVATKRVLPMAFVLATALIPAAVRLGSRSVRDADDTPWATAARARGVGRFRRVRRGLRLSLLPLVSVTPTNVGVLIGGSLLVETHYNLRGIGQLFVEAVGHADYTTVQATLFVFVSLVVGARLLSEVVHVLLAGAPADRDERAATYWTGAGYSWGNWSPDRRITERLRPLREGPVGSLATRVRSNPTPALAWGAAGLGLFVLEAGAVLNAVAALPVVPPLPDLPTLLARDLWPNMGHRTPDGGWTGTAFGLPPALAWALRVGLTYLYALAWAAWAWVGYRIYRSTYRGPDHTPLDAALARLRGQRWGAFGVAVVFVFVVAVVFAPTLGPTTLSHVDGDSTDSAPNGAEPASITYFDPESGMVLEVDVTVANYQTESRGDPDSNIGPGSYDQFGRFHPLGTTGGGTDMFTELLGSARTFLGAGTLATLVALLIALVATFAGRDHGVFDAGSALVAETTAALPSIPAAFFLADQFDPMLSDSTWTGTLLVATVVGALISPALWRTYRGPVARAFDAGWVDAARAFDGPDSPVGRGVLPRVVGHVVTYAALTMVGTAVAMATIASLWGGTPHYIKGILVAGGVARNLPTVSWHTAVVPALASAVVLLGFVALADGVRAAVDPNDDEGMAAPGDVAAAGGAG